MDVFSTVQARRSIRAYEAREVEEEKLRRVLKAGRLAHSASNRQDWGFIVVRDQEARKKLAEAAGGQAFVGTAPVVLVICGTEPEKVMMCGQPAYTVDATIALSFMILEACELGLGTCWLGHFDEKRVKEILGLPEKVSVVAMTPLSISQSSQSHKKPLFNKGWSLSPKPHRSPLGWKLAAPVSADSPRQQRRNI